MRIPEGPLEDVVCELGNRAYSVDVVELLSIWWLTDGDVILANRGTLRKHERLRESNTVVVKDVRSERDLKERLKETF